MVAIQKITIKASNSALKNFFSLLILFVIYTWSVIHTYDYQIAEANLYAGMQPWILTAAGWFYLSIILILLSFITSRLRGNPSDFFIIFYSVIPIVSFFTLTSTSGMINDSILFPSMIVIVIPLVSIFLTKYFFPSIRWHGIVTSKIIDKILMCILLCVVFYTYLNSPASAGFDVLSSYDRRLEGREIYSSGSFIAYMLMMSMNGFAPYLAFRGAINRHSLLVFIACGAGVFFYWLLGVKAPIAYIILGYLVGFVTINNYLKNFIKYFLIGIIGLYFLVSIEWMLFNDYSLIADYGFRRIFPVQAQVQGYYLDFLMVNTPSIWSFLSGVQDPSFSASYYVGNNYLGNPDSNVNTNAFLYAFVANGILGYSVAVFFISFFLVFLDRLYRSNKNPNYLLVGFIYGYLLTEQSFLTALVSSGVGFLFILTFFEKYEF